MVLHAVLSNSMPSSTSNTTTVVVDEEDSFSDDSGDENDEERGEGDWLLHVNTSNGRDRRGDPGRGFERLLGQLSEDDVRSLRLFFHNDILAYAANVVGNGFEVRLANESRRRHRRRLEDAWIDGAGGEFGLNLMGGGNSRLNNSGTTRNSRRRSLMLPRDPNDPPFISAFERNNLTTSDDDDDDDDDSSETDNSLDRRPGRLVASSATNNTAGAGAGGVDRGGNPRHLMFSHTEVGQPKDFMVGFLIGFFLGIIMLFWIWDAHVSGILLYIYIYIYIY
jgi:hypothetical protein